MPELIALGTLPAPHRLERLAARALHRVRRARGLARYDDYRLEWVEGAPFLVLPSVFNPLLLRSGAFFARALAAQPLPADARVLDMGTGSGVCAILAARTARRVVAVDINPAAAHCARLNTVLNGCEHRIEVLHGDLFEPVGTERFDRVLFNPPFYRAAPGTDRDRAWRALDVAERFADGLAAHLTAAGEALLVLSSYGDATAFELALARAGFALQPLATRRYVGERIALLRVLRP